MGLNMKTNSFNGVIILDAGHGKETPGKHSPIWEDGSQLFEWEFNRKVTKVLRPLLEAEGIPVYYSHAGDEDTPLSERVRRINAMQKLYKDSFVISIHSNAGGGTGWECYTSPGVTQSDEIASFLAYEAESTWGKDWTMRFDLSDGDADKEENFYILTKTNCSAVLTENFFMDTKRDCDFISSDTGVQQIAEVHFRAIMNFIIEKYT